MTHFVSVQELISLQGPASQDAATSDLRRMEADLAEANREREVLKQKVRNSVPTCRKLVMQYPCFL